MGNGEDEADVDPVMKITAPMIMPLRITRNKQNSIVPKKELSHLKNAAAPFHR